MTLRLFDTYTRQLREFEPMDPAEVKLYTCGPTVYDYAHLGNLRTYLFEDILRRVLELNGYSVKHVTNITDVGHLVSDADVGEDKMERGSRRTGRSAWEIAEFYTIAFQDDLRHLNIVEPSVWCRATDHISEQIAFVQCIEANGFTYRTADGIYFDTSMLDDYGYLARLDPEGLQAGARVDVAEKRNVTDFALWKFSPPDAQRQMEWDSPWGAGFPGWHIECSAMAVKYLGPYFDIHCGGEDHISVHHPNEIAQTKACYGTHLANFWLHGYFLQLDQMKMAKSQGDFLRIQTLLDRQIEPLAYRYFCLNAHYRSKLNFTWQGIEAAATALNRLRRAVYDLGQSGPPDEDALAAFHDRANNDLNTAQALALTWDVLKSDLPPAVRKGTILKFDRVLGLGLANWQPIEEPLPHEIQRLVTQRQEARLARRWQEADDIRDRLAAAGYEIEDTADGPRVRLRRRPE